ncbi:hypothetical protein [Sphingobacterium sp. LRF_L2]
MKDPYFSEYMLESGVLNTVEPGTGRTIPNSRFPLFIIEHYTRQQTRNAY